MLLFSISFPDLIKISYHAVLCFVMIERKRKRTLYIIQGRGWEPIPKKYKANKSKGTHVMKEPKQQGPH
jgi:hypothetical protein